MTVPVVPNAYAERFRGRKTCTAEVIKARKGWFLHLVVAQEVVPEQSTGKAIGVDRGIARPAVTSDGEFLGDPRWKAVEARLVSLRRRLQAKGTRSSKRHLRRLERRLARFRRDCDHVLAKSLIQSATPGDTLVFEDLTNIRGRVRARGRAHRRQLHAWSFARLGTFVAYKAALGGVNLAYVDPRATSRRCPSCGHIDAKNRLTRTTFRCVRCGYTRNADLVGAWNIRDRYEGLWSPASEAPGPFNDPNVGGQVPAAYNPRTLVRGS